MRPRSCVRRRWPAAESVSHRHLSALRKHRRDVTSGGHVLPQHFVDQFLSWNACSYRTAMKVAQRGIVDEDRKTAVREFPANSFREVDLELAFRFFMRLVIFVGHVRLSDCVLSTFIFPSFTKGRFASGNDPDAFIALTFPVSTDNQHDRPIFR